MSSPSFTIYTDFFPAEAEGQKCAKCEDSVWLKAWEYKVSLNGKDWHSVRDGGYIICQACFDVLK